MVVATKGKLTRAEREGRTEKDVKILLQRMSHKIREGDPKLNENRLPGREKVNERVVDSGENCVVVVVRC